MNGIRPGGAFDKFGQRDLTEEDQAKVEALLNQIDTSRADALPDLEEILQPLQEAVLAIEEQEDCVIGEEYPEIENDTQELVLYALSQSKRNLLEKAIIAKVKQLSAKEKKGHSGRNAVRRALDRLVECGLAEKVDKRKGWKITDQGKKYLQSRES